MANSPQDYIDEVRKQILPRLRLGAFIVPIIFIVYTAMTAIFSVPTESEAVILRFGKFVKRVGPGLHFKLPFGIDRQTSIPVKRQLKQEYGFATRGASNPTQFSSRDERPKEKAMVTGDLNAALVEWVVQYRITQPEQFLFKVRFPEDTLRDVSESVMREAVGDRTVDEVITIGRQAIESEALSRLQQIVNEYGMGLTIDQIQLKSVDPPEPVQSSFDEVNQAKQEREKLINISKGEYNKAVPRTGGEADQHIERAKGYAIQRINEAEGDATRFNALLTEYLKAPEVTRKRLYLETLAEVLPRIRSKIILDDDAKQVLPLLQLNSATQVAK
jgi:membrane protease subunit HflK